MNAITNENIYANIFRNTDIFIPKYLHSNGIVTNPTEIRVKMKTDICMIPAPSRNNAEAIGKTMKTGMIVIDPINDAMSIPYKPDWAPIDCLITVGPNRVSIIPTKSSMAMNCGNIFSKIPQAFFKAKIVFLLSLRKDIINAIPVIIQVI